MADPPRSEGAARTDEERLAHALISRGLLTREEIQGCRVGAESGPEALLNRLVAAGFLTANQARRAGKELETLLGQQIPGYQLMEKLGQGAMGTVYKARQMSMNRLVAVKVLHSRLVANPEFLARLTREAHLAARLSHNNMIQAIDVGSAGPLHYFVMELVEGKTIRETLEAGKVYEEREAIEIILQIAQALQHAHRRGLIHRDVKPANIVLTTEGIA
jgi:serine/threonine protein kinase